MDYAEVAERVEEIFYAQKNEYERDMLIGFLYAHGAYIKKLNGQLKKPSVATICPDNLTLQIWYGSTLAIDSSDRDDVDAFLVSGDMVTWADVVSKLSDLPPAELYRAFSVAFPDMPSGYINTIADTLYKALAKA